MDSTVDADLGGLLEVNRLCDEFERQWRAGRPKIEEFLSRIVPEHRAELARELVALDIDCRRRKGEQPTAADYASHFPIPHRVELDRLLQVVAGRFRLPIALGEYELTERIGGGGMAEVYRARHRRMNRTVAVKVQSASEGDGTKLLKRFDRETEITALLSHPNVVTAFDAREDSGVRYLVTELMPGGDLGRFVREKGPLPVATATAYLKQAALGLAHAHRRGVVHRDVKPGNLLLDAAGIVRVADWGLARLTTESVDVGKQEALTDHDMLLGTVDYLAPEQASRPDRVTGAADVYSLGCVAFFLLAGRPPFVGGGIPDRVAAHRAAPVPNVRDFRPDVPEDTAALVAEMLAKEPADRPADMDAVAARLERPTVSNEWKSIAAEPKVLPRDRNTNRRAFLFGGGLFGIAGTTAWLATRGRKRPSPSPAPSKPEIAIRTMPVEDPAVYRKAWADHLGVEIEMTDERGLRLVFVPPGTFRMGSSQDVIERFADPRGESNPNRRAWVRAEVERSVTVERPYYLGRTEVTVAEFAAFADATGHKTRAERFGGGWGYDATRGDWRSGDRFNWKASGDYKPTANHPVGNMSWDDATRFCQWLAAAAPPGVTYRLPAESEWEFACRAGSGTPWPHGDDDRELDKYAAYGSFRLPQPVAGRRPNAFGFYDLCGNLPEWCAADDPWAETARPAALRAARGGAFFSPAAHVRSAAFQWIDPNSPDPGFRVLREIPSR